jgi:hypothetical protein
MIALKYGEEAPLNSVLIAEAECSLASWMANSAHDARARESHKVSVTVGYFRLLYVTSLCGWTNSAREPQGGPLSTRPLTSSIYSIQVSGALNSLASDYLASSRLYSQHTDAAPASMFGR